MTITKKKKKKSPATRLFMFSIYPKAGTISDRLATLSGHVSLDSYTVAQDEKTVTSTGSFPSLKAQGTSWDQLPQSIPTLRQLPCQEGWSFGWNFRKRKGKPWRGSPSWHRFPLAAGWECSQLTVMDGRKKTCSPLWSAKISLFQDIAFHHI